MREPNRDWEEPFLTALAETGNFNDAAQAAGTPRRTVYHRRSVDPAFEERVREALEAAGGVLEAESRRRAVEGVEERIYWRGAVVGSVRRYSDQLLMALLRGCRPGRYATRSEITGRDGGPIQLQQQPVDLSALSVEELRQLERLLAAAERPSLPATTQSCLQASTLPVAE